MNTNENTSRHIAPIVIRNYGRIFVSLILSIIFIFVARYIYKDDGFGESQKFVLCVCIIGIAICVKIFFMHLKGIVIDVEKDTICFPAIIRYISVPISGIERAQGDLKIKTDNQGNISEHYSVIISGSRIGSYRIRVSSLEKKEHLMAVIARAANLR